MILHANSSLPRSGSELLQVLLSQHPQVYASVTSPLLEYWYGAMNNINLAEVKSQPPELMNEAFKRFCRAGAHGYYSALTERQVIVDKSRGWLKYGELLFNTFPNAKLLCMVRPIEDIIKSLEKIYLANPGHPETRELPITAEKRAQYWVESGSKPLGLMIDRFKERQAQGPNEKIIYIDYNHLVKDPISVMHNVFEHLELETFDINPNKVIKTVIEDDSHYGIFGSHAVRSTIS